jgi:periplasmic copper chaperone A
MKFSFPIVVCIYRGAQHAERRLSLIRICKIIINLTACLMISLSILVTAASAQDLPIKIDHPWMQAVPPVASDTAAFMKIQNLGQTQLKLVGASCTIATAVEPMITTRQEKAGHQMMGMESVPGLDVPAGGTLELRPGGNHLMVLGLKSHPKEGDHVKFVLLFAPNDQQVSIELTVLRHEPE